MDKKMLMMVTGWVLVVGGLLMGYEGLTGTDMVGMMLGPSLAMMVNVVVFGGSALVAGFLMLSAKGKK